MEQKCIRKSTLSLSAVAWLLVLVLLCSCNKVSPPKARIPVQSADVKLGDLVCWKPDAEATVDGKKVDINTIHFPAAVVGINGEKLLVDNPWDRHC
jgi:hypothetical protein